MKWPCDFLFHWYRNDAVARGLVEGDDYAVYAGRCKFCGQVRRTDLPMIQERLNERIGDDRPLVIVPELPLIKWRGGGRLL